MAVKSKNPINAMTINESLGDIPTHVMKSGSCFRPKEDLNRLADFKERIIPRSYRGLPYEYDLWFNTNDFFFCCHCSPFLISNHHHQSL